MQLRAGSFCAFRAIDKLDFADATFGLVTYLFYVLLRLSGTFALAERFEHMFVNCCCNQDSAHSCRLVCGESPSPSDIEKCTTPTTQTLELVEK